MTAPEDKAKKARVERYQKTFRSTMIILVGFLTLTLFWHILGSQGDFFYKLLTRRSHSAFALSSPELRPFVE